MRNVAARTCKIALAACILLIAIGTASAKEGIAKSNKDADTNWSAWKPLFDGKTLNGWKKTAFGGEGEVDVKDGAIRMDFGSSLTGITWNGEFPKQNYEIQLEAQRVDGVDFFVGMTFPVSDDHCSFICGGWAGAVVGLSSVDGHDASENDTTTYMHFKTEQWYKIRLRVTEEAIAVFIDNKKIINQLRKGHKISTRNEVDLSKPFGICAWETQSALRNIQLRKIENSK